jgi:diaminohydroxyphosphoribosylaminopyrimidine deaminase/5-amino-6-(5-phosphoribosylamino)uracil reductase
MTEHLNYMKRALTLGSKGRWTAPPNPWVGCVIVRNSHIVGEGYHHKAGEPHAEIHALKQAGHLARGAAMYVTLEPCAHHGRTGPCAAAIIEAGLGVVYVALEDPDSRVKGKGIQSLREAGIHVNLGLGSELAEESLRPYLHHRSKGRPYCVVKSAISLDGRIAAKDGSSQWITGEEARRNVHELRAESQAVLIGSGTALADKPKLTVRGISLPDQFKQPYRVLLDSRGRVSPTEFQADIVFTSQNHFCKEWEASGAETHVMQQIDIPSVLEVLHKKGVLQLMVEGGQNIYTAFLRDGLVDQLAVYVGACLLGQTGKPWNDLMVPSINDALRLKLLRKLQLGQDIRLDYLCLQES